MQPWYTWAFSGIGCALFGYLINVIQRYFEKGLKAYRMGYYSPNTIVYFSHGSLKEDNTLDVRARRIMTLCSLKNTSFKVSYPITTRGTINSTTSLSHPDMMNLVSEKKGGINSIEIDGAVRNQYFIIASESDRTITPGIIKNRPGYADKVLTTLFEKRLDQGLNRDFSGTRIVAKTDAVKLMVEFDPECCPERVYPIHISEDGVILRGEENNDYISPKYSSSNQRPFFIYRLNSPEINSGFYLWWEWPDRLVRN